MLTLFVRMIASNTVKCMNESIRSPYLVLLPTVVPWVARAVRRRQTYSFFGWRIFTKSRGARDGGVVFRRSEEHTSELQSLMRNSYAVFCLQKKNYTPQKN